MFQEMDLHPNTLEALRRIGFEEPTPVQRETIPLLMEQKDVVGQARTGTGKTGAFGIPLVDAFRDETDNVIVSLIVVPTRELALQVTEEITKFAWSTNLQVVPLIGGTGFGKQTENLQRKGTKILVACPGRLLDMVGRGLVDLSEVEVLILDEADRMLDMGFIHDMEKIRKLVPDDRQTALFSATLDDRVRKLIPKFTKDAQFVRIESGETTAPQVEQFWVKCKKDDKFARAVQLLDQELPERAILFTRTKHLAKRLAQRFSKQGYRSVALQGNMTQSQRERSMGDFRAGKARLMFATDVAARGLDVPEVDFVMNYDIPDQHEQYVHRVGRTGRNGRTGRAFALVEPDQTKEIRQIAELAGKDIQEVQLPPVPDQLPKGPDAYEAPKNPQQEGKNPGHKRVTKSSQARKPQHGRGSGPRRQGGGGGRPGAPRRQGQGAHAKRSKPQTSKSGL